MQGVNAAATDIARRFGGRPLETTQPKLPVDTIDTAIDFQPYAHDGEGSKYSDSLENQKATMMEFRMKNGNH